MGWRAVDILEEVKRIQIDRGLNDAEVAGLLGYKQRETWAKIKGGVARPTDVFVMRARQAFPELVPTPAEASQDKQTGGLKGILDKIVLKVKKFV